MEISDKLKNFVTYLICSDRLEKLGTDQMRNFLYFVGSIVLIFSSILSVIFIHSRLVQANSETFYTNSFIIGLATFVIGLLMVAGGLKKKSRKYRITHYVFPLSDTHEKNAIKGVDIIMDMVAGIVLTVGLLLIVASAILSTTL